MDELQALLEKASLKQQIDQEAKELKDAPEIQPIVGRIKRCHICGAIFGSHDLKPFDAHIPNVHPREACPNCHPQRDIT